MKRRTFLAAAISALTAPLIPAAELAKAAPSYNVWNTATLTAAMEKMFTCQVGPETAKFTLLNGIAHAVPLVEVGPAYGRWLAWAEPKDGEQQFDYVTLSCAIEGGSAEDAEARLAKHFYDNLTQLPQGMLVWRVKPAFFSQESVKYGHTYYTRENVEDKGISYLPEDAELDPVNGSYRKVLSKTQMHWLRMRVSFPELSEDFALPLVKHEGMAMTKMMEKAHG